MNKPLLIIIILAALVGIAVVTCPDEQAHKDKLTSVLTSAVNEKIDQECSNDDYGTMMAMFGGAISNYAIELIINNRLHVENYFVCSIGQVEWKGDNKTCSVGCFGHIFCSDKKDVINALEE